MLKPQMTQVDSSAGFAAVKQKLESIAAAATKVVGAVRANLLLLFRGLTQRGETRERRVSLQARLKDARDRAVAERKAKTKDAKAWGKGKQAERDKQRTYSSKTPQQAAAASMPAPAHSHAEAPPSTQQGGSLPAAPLGTRAAQSAQSELQKDKADSEWLKSIVAQVLGMCANLKRQPRGASDSSSVLTDFTVSPAAVSPEDLAGFAHIREALVADVVKDMHNHVEAGLPASVWKLLRAMATSNAQRKRLQKAKRSDKGNTHGLPVDFVEMIQALRELKGESHKMCKFYLALELGEKAAAMRAKHATDTMPAVHIMPTASTKLNMVQYTAGDLAIVLNKVLGVKAGSFGDFFDFESPMFDSDLRPRNGERALGTPTTIRTDGHRVHMYFESTITRPRFKEGVQQAPKVYTAYGKGKHYVIERNVDPVIMSTVHEVEAASRKGLAKAHEFIQDVRAATAASAGAAYSETDIAAAQRWDAILSDTKQWTAHDPGHRYQFTRDDGAAVPIGLCYQRKRRDKPSETAERLLQQLAASSLHVDSVEQLKCNIPGWITAHARLVEETNTKRACRDRHYDSFKTTSTVDRIVHDLLVNSDGSFKQVIACGANYLGARTLKHLGVAGPDMVKKILHALARRTLVLLGKHRRFCSHHNLRTTCCVHAVTTSQWTSFTPPRGVHSAMAGARSVGSPASNAARSVA